MRVAGVVVEYNPMHNGHCYHLQKTIEQTGADAVVAVMSGNWLQRGEPALINKWSRTDMALQNGIDLVLELPVVYSTQSARLFALGAIATLDALGVVTDVCFGSEKGDLSVLQQFATLLVDPPTQLISMMDEQLQSGLSYPAAYAGALRAYGQTVSDWDSSIVDSPNNMLGLEYLRALQVLNSRIVPHTVLRIAAGYHDTELAHSQIASATAIRRAIADNTAVGSYLPACNAAILQTEFSHGRGPITWDSFRQALFTLLARSTREELARYANIEDGLQVRLKDAVATSVTVHDLIYKVKTRRYTWTRIQRALTSLLLGFTNEQLAAFHLENGPDSIRVLGFTDKGRELLRRSAATASLPIITKISKNVPPMIEANIRSSELYSLAFSGDQAGQRLSEPQMPVIRR